MKKLLLFTILPIILSGCYSAETSSNYNHGFTWANSQSKPIYLSFKDTKQTPFYFLLSRDSLEQDYKLAVRWQSRRKGDILFKGHDTTLKFLVNNSKILTFKPIRRPKIVAYNLNSRGHEEEGVFSLTADEFIDIAYAKAVTVEITGRHNTVVGIFSRRNTMKAFRDFAENSH